MSSHQYNLKIILLAAGKSERFEAVKLLAKVKLHGRSVPLIQHILQKISAALTALKINQSSLHVATGEYHEQISSVIEHQFSVDYCSDAHLGLGHTIAQSVESIINNYDNTSHIMIALADQIALSIDNYIQLIESSVSNPDKLICAKSGIEIMPPAIFPHCYFAQLMKLTGDKGAKMLLHQNKKHLQEVSLPDAEVDIDTQQDLLDWHQAKLLA